MKRLTIHAARLEQAILELGRIGVNGEGGLDRTTFTPAELTARNWVKEKAAALGLDVRVDEAANIWAARRGKSGGLPAIAFGSHVDTVPNGGKYDGALGVLLALEIMLVLKEQGIRTRHPLELVSFSAEEPNPFGLSTFGSRSIAGKLTKRDLEGVRDDNGTLLIDALREAGGNPERFEQVRRKPEEFAAFLEVHIEQGKRLLRRGIPVGIVTAVTGIYREEVTVVGVPNHAGTTLMQDRKDALTGAAEAMLALERVCLAHQSDETVGTVGRIANDPNAANIIPGKVRFHMEIRGRTRDDIQEAVDKWEVHAALICSRRGVRIERRLLLDQHPVAMDRLIIETCALQAEKLGYPYAALGSMAGHDAAHMASLTRTGMLFVPSLDGRSHCPEEESRIDDMEKAGNVLLHAILDLDEKLDA
ncbi:Zn-dependent hydrolase [Paenibacillus harenae]|uniref:Zn-dependent hydrolase n=1 Tax=Paenibacillus harenae TaxID=306543 RepID=UPI000429CEBB|nr:Zn-dependent hydrolase [Paenibacillus harenae]